jgi:thiol-disulfide isomerase/thioredoxin
MKNIIQFILVIVIAGGAGFGLQRYLQQDERELTADIPGVPTNKIIGQMRPTFEIADLEGQPRNVSEWDDHVLLINFWATWCPPCKKEMPAFIELQEQYAEQGFKVIGIALDDQQSVQDFADTIGVNYPLLIAEYDGIDLSRSYGNHVGALPFSAFVDRQGKVVSTHMGELSKDQVEGIIKPLM